jgi:hypothetical protein
MGTAITYAAYLVISTVLTVTVGTALSRSGRVFLASALGGDERLATAVDRLLLVAFYLLSFGFVTLTLQTSGQITSFRQASGVLSVKIGEELLVLGFLHLANMIFFARFRRRPRPQPPQPPGGQEGRGVPPGRPGEDDRPPWRPAKQQALR